MPTDDMAKRYPKGVVDTESEQPASAREYSPDYPLFKQLGRTGGSRYAPTVRNDKHGRVFTYSPDKISIQEYDEMRFDGQIRAGLTLIKLPIIQSPWSIMCDDPEISSFWTKVLTPMWPELIRQILIGLDFGYSVFEIVPKLEYAYRVTPGQGMGPSAGGKLYPKVVVPEKFVHLDPLTIFLLAYRWSGDFAGVRQYIQGTAIIPGNKCLLFSNDVEFQEWYGVSRLKACYPYWIFKRLMYEWVNIHYETWAIPTVKMTYPLGSAEAGLDSNGNPVEYDNVDTAIAIGESVRNKSVMALPSNQYQNGNAQWDAEVFESSKTGSEHLEYIDHLNVSMLKALLVPQLALEIGGVGSHALAETQVDFFFLGEQALMDQIEAVVSNQLLKSYTRYNYGRHAPLPYFKFKPLDKGLKDGLQQMLMGVFATGEPIPMKDGSSITPDWKWISDNTGIPLETITSLEQDQMDKRMADRQAAMMPEGADQQGGNYDGSGGPGSPSNFGGKPYQYGNTGGGANPSPSSGPTKHDDDTGYGDAADEVQNREWAAIEGELVCLAE